VKIRTWTREKGDKGLCKKRVNSEKCVEGKLLELSDLYDGQSYKTMTTSHKFLTLSSNMPKVVVSKEINNKEEEQVLGMMPYPVWMV
jgi:hypothetical protein